MTPGLIKRPYGSDPDDENGVYYMWSRSYGNSRFGKHQRQNRTGVHELQFWEDMRPIIAWHLDHTNVEIVTTPRDKSVIYAFASTSADAVHCVVVRNSVKQRGLTRDVLALLLGDRLKQPQVFTSDLVDMRLTSTLPDNWVRDEHWFLRKQLSAGRRAA